MADLVAFRRRVLELMRSAVPYDGDRPTQADLAAAIGLSRVTLNRRLSGAGHQLSQSDVRAIIRTLAAWEVLTTRAEAEELLQLAACPSFSAAEWLSPPLDLLSSALPSIAPDNSSHANPPHNLPAPLTSFVGRQREIKELDQMLREHRLVTITGTGGAGKSRLALEVARGLNGSYRDGVFLIELSALSETGQVAAAIADGLGVHEQPRVELQATLTAYLKDKQILLIVDNCEHLLEAVATSIHHLISHCPGLTVLATSRQSLRLLGEAVFRVPPLGLPAAGADIAANHLARYDAIRLFTSRAMARDPHFRLSQKNAAAVRQICLTFDGNPLAIELAAAKVDALSVQEIAAGLATCLNLLNEGYRMSQPRHQTLRASLDWSWQLLNEKEQHLLIHSAAFAGNFSAQAAAAVSGEVGELALTEALLTQLRDQGLVQEIGGAGGERRYQLLETVRQYISERLVQREEDTFVRQRHACYYLELAEEAAPRLERAEQEMALKQLELEHDNLRAALRYLIGSGQAELAQREVGALWRFWYYRGHFSEGLKLLVASLELATSVSPTVRARALLGLGGLLWVQGEDAAARPHMAEALQLYREAGDRWGEARTLHMIGTGGGGVGREADGLWCFEESIRIKRELGDQWGVAHTLGNLANGYAAHGRREQARQLREEALAIRRELGDKWGMAVNLHDIGSNLKEDGNGELGRCYLEEALTIQRQLGDTSGQASTLLELVELDLLRGELDKAAALLAESDRLYTKLEDSRDMAWVPHLEGRIALLRGELASAQVALRRAAELGQAEFDDPAVLYPHLLWQAALYQAQGDGQHAATLYGALAQVVASWLHLAPIYKREQLAGMARATTLIGEAAFSIHFQRGKELSTEALTRYLTYGWEPTADDERAGEEASSGNPTCSSCSGNPLLVRAGYNRSGSSRYQCPICHRRTTIAGHQRGHAAGVRQQAVALYRSGCSLRQIATQLGVSHQSVANWLKPETGN